MRSAGRRPGGAPLPPYYVEFVYPEDLGEPGGSNRDLRASARGAGRAAGAGGRGGAAGGKERWDAADDAHAVGYLVWQSDWTVVGGIDLVG